MSELAYYSVMNDYNILCQFVIPAALGTFLGFVIGSNGSILRLAGNFLIIISIFNMTNYFLYLQLHGLSAIV